MEMEADSGSRRRRSVKRKQFFESEESCIKGKQFRPCEKAGCPALRPVCCARFDETCCGSGYTSRWYHMSDGEHFCNACFDYIYRSGKDGYETYTRWKYDWSTNGQREANVKVYVSEMVMPYWVQCKICSKWREFSDKDFTTDVIKTWNCGSQRLTGESEDKNKALSPCSVAEDERVSAVSGTIWLDSLTEPPLLQYSPVAQFLTSYFPDGVGLSPTSNNWTKKAVDATGYVELFYHPDNTQTAHTFRPDIMEPDEKEEFPEFLRHPLLYLALRNLILSLWMLNHKEFLTPKNCADHVIVRGLVRVLMVREARRILFYLTKKGYVNHGILNTAVPTSLTIVTDQKLSVVVIGAGAAGLAAARHLKTFGVQVTVLESRDRIGGRVWDDSSLGCCVGKGAQILNGCINNPVSVLCEQAGVTMHHMGSKCDLLTEDSKCVDSSTDSKVEFHFNALLDAIADQKTDLNTEKDESLEDKVWEMHNLFLEETQVSFSELEEKLLQFHLGNLEFSCAAPLNKVSTLSWDQNEAYPQFSGDHTLLHHGFGVLLSGLAQDLDIKLQCEVKEIDHSNNKVVLIGSEGQRWTADKVIVTVPLFLLKSGRLKFTPPLPERKQTAISNIGAGLIEKVVLKFKYNFWQKVVQGADFFGHVPQSHEGRGHCGLFYDLSKKEEKKSKRTSHVLMTVLSGEAAVQAQKMSEKQVVDACMNTLRKLFPYKIPEPVAYLVTSWGRDRHSGMAYSYIPIGTTGEEYDHMACDIDHKIFFAGEATNRQFPQTVTGAYLSGIREAAKILTSIEPVE